MSFPSQRDVDALKDFEDDEFDALLRGGSSKLTPSKSPSLHSASASAASNSASALSSTHAGSSAITGSAISQSAPSKAKVSSKAAATLSDGAAAAPPPLTFGSTSFLSELQNRRKHVMHDNSLKAGASDDDSDPLPAAVDKKPLAPSATVPKHAISLSEVPGVTAAGGIVETHAAKLPVAASQMTTIDTLCDKAAPDASACLRRLDRLPSTVEKCLKEYDDACVEETKGLLGGLFKYCKKKFTADQGIYTADDVVKILKESFSHVSEQWVQSHEDHSSATVATISKATSRIRKDVASLASQATELHATVNSAQALGISGGGGGGGKSVAEIVEMAKEIQALTKKVEKLKTQKKSQDQKVAELQVWEESVPMLRSMLEEAMEQKAQLQAEKEDCTRLRQGMALTWVPDAAVHKCLNCEVVFGVRKWKNHCRYCGRVFCWDCTSRKLELRELGYNYEVPVCDHCHNLISNK